MVHKEDEENQQQQFLLCIKLDTWNAMQKIKLYFRV